MATSNENTKYLVEPFSGKNFTLFKRRVEAVFTAKELEKYLEHEADKTKATEVKDTKKAYALLLSLLDDSILATLATESTACQIWTSLKKKYLKVSAVSQILVRKKLATLKKRRECSMQQHINELLAIVNDLRLSGAEVKDMDVVIYLLMSLPADYDVIKSTIENQPNETLTLDFVIQRLLSAEELKGEKNTNNVRASSDNVAFSANKRDIVCHKCRSKGHIAKFCKRKLVCFGCGRPGHYKKDCKFKPKSDNTESAAVTFVVGHSLESFILDSGASTHMCNKSEWFDKIKPFSGTVACASKSDILKIEGIGTVSGTVNGRKIILTDVLYIPELNGQLISVKNIQSKGYSVIFKNDIAIIENNNGKFEFAKLNNKGQYVSLFQPIKASVYSVNQDAKLWHRRMGHSSNKVLKEMGLPVESSGFCEECIVSKQTNEPTGKGPRQRENKPMRMIHTDVCGPINPPTHNGEKYFLTLIDDYSRFGEVHLLKNKSDIVDILNSFFKQNSDIYKIRCDNAKEYVTGELVKLCKKAGILIDPAPPYTPFLNGVAERANRYLLEKARALIYEAKLSKDFWGYAVQTAVYLKNRMPCQSNQNCIPFELKYEKSPDLDVIKVFGCDAYMRIPDSQRKKLDPKSRKMTFVGFSSMGYRLFDPITRRVVISRNVKFNEVKKVSIMDTLHDNAVTEENSEDTLGLNGDNDDDSSKETDVKNLRPKRDAKLPTKLKDYYVYEAFSASLDSLSYEDLQKLPAEEQIPWIKAMDDEMDSIKSNEVWDLVDLGPEDKQPISCKWILTKKRNGRYKARLVARGFMQTEGLDYTTTFSPVISMPALRLVLVIILNENMTVSVLDVKTAFLNGKLNELIFMDQPEGYDDNNGRKCKLKKMLYVLKQTPRHWYERFVEFITKLSFKHLDSEPCIFIRNLKSKKVIIALYVDDLLIAGSDDNETNIVISLLSKEFQMSKLESVSEFLGIRMKFTSDSLIMDQESYIKKLLDKFNMSECKPCNIPMCPKSTSADFEKGDSFTGPFRELVGCLMYLAYASRPDILYAVNCLSQIQENPTVVGWNALKKILRYLKGTATLKLVYKREMSNYGDLCMYVDADWGSNTNNRKSISGYVIMFCNLPILWCCNKQKCVALSSTEAEVIALSKSMQDLLWLKGIISEIVNITKIVVFEDNQSCIKYITNENNHGRMKHIDIKLKFIRDVINVNNIKIEYVPTDKQVADMFTKSLPKPKFYELLSLCNLYV